MVRAFSTLGCPDADLRFAFQIAERHHLDGIELRALGDTTNLPAYFASEYGGPEAFGTAMRSAPVRIAAIDTSFHLADAKTSDREQFLAFLPWAEAAGVRWLRVFDGGTKLSERAAIAAAAEAVLWWREARADGGFTADIMVETHHRLLTSSAVKRFIAAAPETVILWDAHHTWRQGGENPVATWKAIGRHVVHVHVNDSVSVEGKAQAQPYKFVLPGTGEFPMAALREAFAADNFSGTVSLEWEKLWHPDLPSVDDALRAATEHAWW
jgi:sugar phosphate isomerase/epimerase